MLELTRADWKARDRNLAERMASFISDHAPGSREGLDVGAARGDMTHVLAAKSGVAFRCVDPNLPEDLVVGKGGVVIHRGWAHDLPFEDQIFDVVVLASVYEHLPPELRIRSLGELYRVLRPSGVLVGQIPNMYFPIELHSRLPFQAYLPRPIAKAYLRAFKTSEHGDNEMNWWLVGPRRLVHDAKAAGLVLVAMRGASYSPDALPRRVRKLAPLLSIMPLGYDFCFRKP